MRWGYRLLLICSVIALVGAGVWYSREIGAERIRVVVPEGFVGTIRMEFECADGAEMRRVGGWREIRVPGSGRVRLKGRDPFLKWHRVAGVTEGGRVLRQGGKCGLDPAGDYLWSVGTVVGREEEWFAAGSRKDRDAAIGEKWRSPGR